MKNEMHILVIIYARNVLVKKVKEVSGDKNLEKKISLKIAKKITEKVFGGHQHPSFFWATGLVKSFILFCSGKTKLEPKKQLEAAEIVLEYQLMNKKITENRCLDCVTYDLSRIMGIDMKLAREFAIYLYEKNLTNKSVRK